MTVDTTTVLRRARHEHSIPLLWPFAAGIELEAEGLRLLERNLAFLRNAARLVAPPEPAWASANRVILDLETMRVRDFTPPKSQDRGVPVVIAAPYAGHSATIADYADGQSLVRTLQRCGIDRTVVTDWKAATPAMKDFGIDQYLAELNVLVDDLGGAAILVGLCQGGWMSAMYAARYPAKVKALVLAGAPIDTHAGDGPLKRLVTALPDTFYEELVAAGGGLMRGETMLAGWKHMHPEQQYLGKFIELYEHIDDPAYLDRTETFERWYENPIDLPGRYYLQVVRRLFRDNDFALGRFDALGRRITLREIACPLYLLAGENDDITTKEQVFAARRLVSTDPSKIRAKLVAGGHIGLFMGRRTLDETWPEVGSWLRDLSVGAPVAEQGRRTWNWEPAHRGSRRIPQRRNAGGSGRVA